MFWTLLLLFSTLFGISYHIGELQKQVKALNEKLDSLMAAKNE